MNKAVGNNIFNLSSVEVKLEDRSVHCCNVRNFGWVIYENHICALR